MVKFLVGGKGEGKTKKLIEMANTDVKDAHGHVVYIDDDNRHIYDLHYDVRFVDTTDYPLSNYRELIGFIYGILSQDGDIEKIYLDGLYNLVKTLENDDLIKLTNKLKSMSEKYSVEFIIAATANKDELPDDIKELLI
ncbi:MAG: twitching motility protein PilT [Firmicutes bacterium]|nr:twitching motility protein PilT [Bacillota bacterium]